MSEPTAIRCTDGTCREDWCGRCWDDVEANGTCRNCGRQSFLFEGDWLHNDGTVLCVGAGNSGRGGDDG